MLNVICGSQNLPSQRASQLVAAHQKMSLTTTSLGDNFQCRVLILFPASVCPAYGGAFF